MPTEIDGTTYYKMSEAAGICGISRSTLVRWLDRRVIEPSVQRDRRGWRVFTQAQVEAIREEAHRIE